MSFVNLNLTHRRVLIFAEGCFGGAGRKKFPFRAKTADGVLRYAPYPIVGVLDSQATEASVGEVLGVRPDVPIFPSKEAALDSRPDVWLFGTAPEGGQFPAEWRLLVLWALQNGMDVVAGFHSVLGEDAEFSQTAQRQNRQIFDMRVIPSHLGVGSARAYAVEGPIILTVGTDAAIGKMTVSLELQRALEEKGQKACFIPTGQTGIMIAGFGICIDALPGDFMAGAVEEMVLAKHEEGYEYLLVEGQGSLFHPGFSNTTIALIHGCVPTHLILVHRPKRRHTIGSSFVKLPSLKEAIHLHEEIVLPKERKARVVGIALNTWGMNDAEAKEAVFRAESETGLPTTDVLRFGVGKLTEALLR